MIVPSDIWYEIFRQQRLQRFNEAKSNMKTMTFINITTMLTEREIYPITIFFVKMTYMVPDHANSGKRLVAQVAISI
jgi:hypothetical protein